MRSLLLRSGAVCTLSLLGLGDTAALAWPNSINYRFRDHQFRDYQIQTPNIGTFEFEGAVPVRGQHIQTNGPLSIPLNSLPTEDWGKPTKGDVFSPYHWSNYVCGQPVYYYIDLTNPFNSSCQIDPNAMDETRENLLDEPDPEKQNDFSSGF